MHLYESAALKGMFSENKKFYSLVKLLQTLKLKQYQ